VASSFSAHAPVPATLLVGNTMPGGGTGWVQIPNANALNPSGGLAIEAWVFPTEISGSQTIYGKHWETGVSAATRIRTTEWNLRMRI